MHTKVLDKLAIVLSYCTPRGSRDKFVNSNSNLLTKDGYILNWLKGRDS